MAAKKPAKKKKTNAAGKGKSGMELSKINDIMMDCVIYYSGERKTATARSSVETLSPDEVVRTGSELDYNPILPSLVLANINPRPVNWDQFGKVGGI